MFGARFDDVTRGESFVLKGVVETFAAMRLDDVAGVIEAASRAAQRGHWVAGYVAYEAAPAFDPSFNVRPTRRPLVWFGVFEHRMRVDAAMHDPNATGAYSVSRWSPAIDRGDYEEVFADVKSRIEAGKANEVYLAFPLRAAFTGSTDVFYEDLVCAQRPPYASHIWHDNRHVLSVSPERFFAVDDATITIQPMKGTALRGRWLSEDLERKAALVSSDGQSPEHDLVIDALCEELGLIADAGSFVVDEACRIERFRTVWQMTSTLSAQLHPETSLVDIFGALFPCSSVTGIPKSASMELIADAESDARGVYCGAVGYLPPGNGVQGASFNVAIRTVEVDDEEGLARYGVGGVVTGSSTVENEYDEAVTKSEVLRFDVSWIQLVETIRWDRQWLWCGDHLDRLEHSARYWSFSFDRMVVAKMLEDLGNDLSEPTAARVVLGVDGSVSITTESAPSRWLPGPGLALDTVRLALDPEPVDDRNPRLFHRTSDMRVFRVRADRHRECDDVLLINRQGMVTQTTNANVAFLMDGQWYTPPISDGLLGGVMRRRLIGEGRLHERSISVTDAVNAEAAALVSSVRGWCPAVIAPIG